MKLSELEGVACELFVQAEIALETCFTMFLLSWSTILIRFEFIHFHQNFKWLCSVRNLWAS